MKKVSLNVHWTYQTSRFWLKCFKNVFYCLCKIASLEHSTVSFWKHYGNVTLECSKKTSIKIKRTKQKKPWDEYPTKMCQKKKKDR